MKKAALIILLIVAIAACRNESNQEQTTTTVTPVDQHDDNKNTRSARYNTPIAKTLLAHGGLKKWDNLNNLCYEFEGRSGKEVHTTSLKKPNGKNRTQRLGNRL